MLPITLKQKEAIELIEKYTRHKFNGKGREDAFIFIGKYMEESKVRASNVKKGRKLDTKGMEFYFDGTGELKYGIKP